MNSNQYTVGTNLIAAFNCCLGMAHLWNIPDTGVPSVVENKVEVTTAVHPLHLKMEMMMFSDGNCKLKVCSIIYKKDLNID